MVGSVKTGWMAGVALVTLAGAWPLQALAAEGADAAPNEVDQVVVTGVQAKPESTKSDIPVLETPQAVSVVSAATLQDQGVTRLADALRNVAGVSRSSTYGYFDSYQIRGYDAAYGSIFLDGLSSRNVAGAVNELAGLEQVEVIKGPASALFGAAPLGGIVNLVSKRPREEASLDVGVGVGSYDAREVTIDANTPLTQSGDLLARINLVYRDADAFVDNSHAQRIYIAPALTWKIAENTRLTMLVRLQRDYTSPWSPVTAYGTVLPNVNGRLPINFAINGNGANRAVYNTNAKQIGYVFDHRFNEVFSFSQTLRFEQRSTYWNRWMFAAGVSADQKTIGRYYYGPFSQTDKDFAVDSRLTAKFATGALRHNVLGGVDFRQNRNSYTSQGNYDGALNPLDLFNPDYSIPLDPTPNSIGGGGGHSRQLGVYVQDHINLGDDWTVTLGGRWDWATADGQKDDAFTPRFGITRSLTPVLSAYFNYAESFTPQTGYLTFDGAALPPETGQNIEGGFKLGGTGSTLTGLVSIFQLTRQNVATGDAAHPNFYVVTGEQRSRGIEVEGTWHPTPAWRLSAAYAYTEAQVTRDNSYVIGQRLPNAPRNSLNLYGKYVVQDGPLANLGVSLAVLYNSSKSGSLIYPVTNPSYERGFTLPSYTLVDFGLSYRLNNWGLQLNVNNILDERYYPDACCLDRVTPGEPRNWRFVATRSF